MILVFGAGSDMFPGIQSLYPDTVGVTEELCDVTNYQEIEGALKNSLPDVIVNLAGVSNLQPIKDSARIGWIEEVAVNLMGSYNIARASINSGVKTMIFIGSVAGKYGKGTHSGYAASKAGVISLVQSLGQEGYNAYCISPGRVDTKLREKDFPNERKETRLRPEEIANIIPDILDGKYQSGDNIVIRRIGIKTRPIIIDRGAPWKKRLKIGQPPVC